jgi:3-phenylpropionate/cinnamic acid dioxygenase small subunit
VAESSEWIGKAQIAELITRYAALNDAADWDGVAALYTEDGRMNRPSDPDVFVVGRSAILAAFKARPPRIARHIVANVLVTIEGNARASASSQILLFAGSSASPPLIGTYYDRLVHTELGWRFTERRGSLDFSVPK